MENTTFADLERTTKSNIFARNFIKIKFEEYKNRILNKDSELIKSLFYGDIYIVQDAYNKKILEKIKLDAHSWGTTTKDTYHPIKEGVPNFHRIVNEDGKFYAKSKWHGYYFFNFNDNPWDIFELIKEKYFLNKKIEGTENYSRFENKGNEEYVTRAWLVQYNQGGGYIQTHNHEQEPFFLSNITIMSEKGKDYQSGGIFFLDERANKIFIDDQVEFGDYLVFYKKQVHGVDPIDPKIKLDWKSDKGRWVLIFADVTTNP